MPLNNTTKHNPPIRAVYTPLFPTLASLQDVIDLAQSNLPIINKNDITAILGVYHNTLIQQLEKESLKEKHPMPTIIEEDMRRAILSQDCDELLNMATVGIDSLEEVGLFAEVGINISDHSNAIVVYAETLEKAQVLCDEILRRILRDTD